jgi:hypothetical protein
MNIPAHSMYANIAAQREIVRRKQADKTGPIHQFRQPLYLGRWLDLRTLSAHVFDQWVSDGWNNKFETLVTVFKADGELAMFDERRESLP